MFFVFLFLFCKKKNIRKVIKKLVYIASLLLVYYLLLLCCSVVEARKQTLDGVYMLGLDDSAKDILKGLRLLSTREDISSLDRDVGHALDTLPSRLLDLLLHLVGAFARVQIPLHIRLIQAHLASTLNQRRDLATLVLLEIILKQLIDHLVLLAVLGRIQNQSVRVQRVDDVAVVAEGNAFLLADLQHPVADQGCALGAELAGVHGHLGDRGL